MYSIQLNVKPFIAEYIAHKYRDRNESAIVIPSNTEIYCMLLDLLRPRPEVCPLIRGNLEITLPHKGYGKRVEKYNYLSLRSQQKIENYMTTMMWADFHRHMDFLVHQRCCTKIKAVEIFIAQFGITTLSEDAFVKNYYRYENGLLKNS